MQLTKFENQEKKLDQLIKESLIEGKHFQIYKDDRYGYQWSTDLTDGSWVGDEFSYDSSHEAAVADAITDLTKVYKELACTPLGVPVEYRDFIVSQDDPNYSSWWSRGVAFGNKYKKNLFGDKHDARENAIWTLYRESKQIEDNLTDPFVGNEIVEMIRSHTSESFRQWWHDRYVMPEIEAIFQD